VGGFYSEVALQKREAEGTVRTKRQLNLDPNPEGPQKNLDDRQYCGNSREEQRIPHVGGGEGGARCDRLPSRAGQQHGQHLSSTVTNDGASVPEVLTPAKLENVLAVVVVPHLLELALRPTVGDDEEKAQKLSMHPPTGRHDAGQEGIGVTSPGGIALVISTNLGACCGLEELSRVRRAQLSVAGDISHVIAPELVVERDVNDEVAVPPKVDGLEHQISPSNFPVGLCHRRDVAPLCLDPYLVTVTVTGKYILFIGIKYAV